MVTQIQKIVVGVPSGKIARAAAANATTLGGESAGYYTDFENLNNVPNILDSAEIAALIASTVDSGYVGVRLDDQILRFVNKDHIDGLGINASTLNGESADYFLDWNNLQNIPVEIVYESAMTSAIDSAINSIINLAPEQLNTLNELAEAIGDDANFINTITDLANSKLDSSKAINLIDSDYINSRVNAPPEFDFDSAIQDVSVGIIPKNNTSIDLGSNTRRFRDLYIGGSNSIIMGSLGLSDSDGKLVIKDQNGNVSAVGIVATTKELVEDFNLFYTKARVDSDFDSRLTTKTTTDLAEGDNLYYTSNRVDSDIISLVDSNYIRSRQADIFRDSGFISNIIDSSYINSRVTSISSGGDVTIGSPTDGDINDGAFTGFVNSETIADAIDHLNEAMNNVRNDTFVRSVTFTGSPTTGGAGTNVTLSLDVDGNSNRYDVYWGDGTIDSAISDNTPSHVYTSNEGSPYTVRVKAFNNNGFGSGSSAEFSRDDYIVIFTADPSVAFRLYREPTEGTQLSGNNLYVIEGQSLYMENITTNTSGADVTYTMEWGDGEQDAIANDSAAGGVFGDRLGHSWLQGTNSGTSSDTVRLTLETHSTATPASLPMSALLSLKVYDDGPTPPNTLETKTITLNGQDAKLASGVTNNTSTTTISPGSNVERFTSGSISTSDTSTFAYNNHQGHLVAYINDASDGGADLTSGPIINQDAAALRITDSSDYNLLNTSGSSVSFSSSIYYPKLYDGYKARIIKEISSLPVGINNAYLKHEGRGKTNTVSMVKDDLTTAPTITSAGSLAETSAGTLVYKSGVPFYTDDATLTLSGTQISNLVGQTYSDISNVFTIASGTNFEGTTGASINDQTYDYSGIDGSVTMLNSGVPIKETGVGSPYSIGNLSFTPGLDNIYTGEQLRVRARNINGYSSYIDLNEKIHVYNLPASSKDGGVRETSIEASSNMGATLGTPTDDARRIFHFANTSGQTPTIQSDVNYFFDDIYTEDADPGVAGTQEATVRFGSISVSTEDYSSYLPAGPDRSNDTGTQYFTCAFRRRSLANFKIELRALNGISGLWIAAPGTDTQSASTLNGWLDASIAFNGSGYPGAGSGGNGSNGCGVGALVPINGDPIGTSGSNEQFEVTIGINNFSDATDNTCLIRIALTGDQTVDRLKFIASNE